MSDMTEPDDWGCDYCRNDGKLTAGGLCPYCDAHYPEEDKEETP
jgi:hypothetical protein